MSEIDAEATAHRTLDIGIAKLPYSLEDLPESKASVFRKAGARTAYTIRDKKLVRTMYLAKEDPDFVHHATQWEKLHSSLVLGDGGGKAFPLVDESGVVVGHYGEDIHERHFYTPGGGGDLETLVEQGVDVFVDTTEHSSSVIGKVIWKVKGYEQYSSGRVESISVITDVDGRVVQVLSKRSRDGLTPVYYSPFDLVLAARLVLVMGRTAARKMIRTLARRPKPARPASGAKPKLPIHGDPPTVNVGPHGQPGNLRARIEVTRDGEVTYLVTSIHFGGSGDAPTLALARAAHREMIRRAAQLAQKAGKRTFTMKGEQGGPNFQRHANELANKIGIPGSARSIPNTPGGYPDYMVTLDVAKVLPR